MFRLEVKGRALFHLLVERARLRGRKAFAPPSPTHLQVKLENPLKHQAANTTIKEGTTPIFGRIAHLIFGDPTVHRPRWYPPPKNQPEESLRHLLWRFKSIIDCIRA